MSKQLKVVDEEFAGCYYASFQDIEENDFIVVLPVLANNATYLQEIPKQQIIDGDVALQDAAGIAASGREIPVISFDSGSNLNILPLAALLAIELGQWDQADRILCVTDSRFSDVASLGRINLIAELGEKTGYDPFLTTDDFGACLDPVTYADLKFNEMPVVYCGDICDSIAERFGVGLVIDSILSSMYSVFGAEEFDDIAFDFDILGALSMDRVHGTHGEFREEMENSSAATTLLYREDGISTASLKRNDVYRSYADLATEIDNLSDIWKSVIRENGIGIRGDMISCDRCDQAQWLSSVSYEFAIQYGIDHMLQAYYSGTPIADIVA